MTQVSRRTVTGLATAGLSLPLLAACGSDDPDTASDPGDRLRLADGGTTPSQAESSSAAAAAAIASTSDIEVGGGTIFADEQVVDHPADRGRVQGVQHDLHPPGLPGDDGLGRHTSTARATAAGSRSRTAHPTAARRLAARGGRHQGRRRPDHPGLGPASGRSRQPPVARRVPPVEPAVEHHPRLVEPAGAEQGRDPGLLDDLALGVRAAEPPALGRARRAGRPPPSAARSHRREREGERRDHLAVGGMRGGAGPGRQPAEAGRRRRAPAGRPRRASPGTGWPAARATARSVTRVTSAMSGTSSAPGVSAHRNSSEPVSTRARQPRP